MDGNISFNGNSYQTYNPTTDVGIISNVIDHTDGPDSTFELLAIVNANASSAGDNDSPGRTIPIGGVIKGSTQVDLDQRIDAFKASLVGKEKNLDINYAGSTRRYIATAPTRGVKIKRDGTKLYANFTVQFLCSQPFGRDTAYTTLISELNHTTGTYTANPTIGGTAEYQLPVFTITIDALTGTGDYVQISNDANEQAILIFGQSLTSGDILVIDCERRIVTLNGAQIDYNGTLLELTTGANSITYTDGFTTRTVDIEAKYYKRYL